MAAAWEHTHTELGTHTHTHAYMHNGCTHAQKMADIYTSPVLVNDPYPVTSTPLKLTHTQTHTHADRG